MAEHSSPKIPGLVDTKLLSATIRGWPRLSSPAKRRMRIVDATIDDADDRRPCRHPEERARRRRESPGRCLIAHADAARRRAERETRSAGLSMNSLGRPLSI